MHPYLKEIIAIFSKHGDPQKAAGAKAYLLHQFDFFGIQTPTRRSLSKAFYATHLIQDHNELCAIVKACFEQPQRELHYFAIELLGYHKKMWSKKTLPLIEWMITHYSWWDSVDSTNSNVISKFFIVYPEHIPTYTSKWNRSNNKWLKRMSILFQLTYKKNTDKELLARHIEYCIAEEDFFIKKAIGWALRAYANHDPKWVKAFVKAHPDLSPLSKREALKHHA